LSDILETFSEGTSFQPLIICLVFESCWGIGRTLRIAERLMGPKGDSWLLVINGFGRAPFHFFRYTTAFDQTVPSVFNV